MQKTLDTFLDSVAELNLPFKSTIDARKAMHYGNYQAEKIVPGITLPEDSRLSDALSSAGISLEALADRKILYFTKPDGVPLVATREDIAKGDVSLEKGHFLLQNDVAEALVKYSAAVDARAQQAVAAQVQQKASQVADKARDIFLAETVGINLPYALGTTNEPKQDISPETAETLEDAGFTLEKIVNSNIAYTKLGNKRILAQAEDMQTGAVESFADIQLQKNVIAALLDYAKADNRLARQEAMDRVLAEPRYFGASEARLHQALEAGKREHFLFVENAVKSGGDATEASSAYFDARLGKLKFEDGVAESTLPSKMPPAALRLLAKPTDKGEPKEQTSKAPSARVA